MWTCVATLSGLLGLLGLEILTSSLPLATFRALRFKRCMCFRRMVGLGQELFAKD
jgi:hypothetical protein